MMNRPSRSRGACPIPPRRNFSIRQRRLKEESMEIVSVVRSALLSLAAVMGLASADVEAVMQQTRPPPPRAPSQRLRPISFNATGASNTVCRSRSVAGATPSWRPSSSKRETGAKSTTGPNRSASSAARMPRPSLPPYTRRSSARNRRSRPNSSSLNMIAILRAGSAGPGGRGCLHEHDRRGEWMIGAESMP